MSGFWRNWLNLWCWAVVLFGAILAAGGFAATSSPASFLLGVMGGIGAPAMEPPLRFAVGLMGALTMALGLLVLVTADAARRLGAEGGPIWRRLTGSLVAWFLVDSTISIATGFWLNAVSNVIIMVLCLLPLWRGGVLRRA